MNRNNQSEYEPNIYGSANKQSQGYMPNTYHSDGKAENINTYNPNEQKEKKSKTKSIIISVIFVLWFIGSMALLVFFASIKFNNLAFAMFGEIMLVACTSMLFNTKNGGSSWKIMPSIFVLLGALILMCGVSIKDGLKAEALLFTQTIHPIVAYVIVGVGLLIIIVSIVLENKKIGVCTKKVEAVVSELKVSYQRSSNGRRIKLYAPVYEYQHNGITYTHSSSFYTNIGVKPVGTRINNMYINPLNPNEVYIKFKGNTIIGSIVGILVMAIGVYTFFQI